MTYQGLDILVGCVINMPITKKWSNYKKKHIEEVDNVYAVYELADGSKEVIYIGEGKLRERLLAHITDGSDPIPTTSHFRFETTGSKTRCVQRQNYLLNEFEQRYGRLPKYNQRGSA